MKRAAWFVAATVIAGTLLLLSPFGVEARVAAWKDLAQTITGAWTFRSGVDLRQNALITDTTAPTASQGSTSGGTCSNANTYRVYISQLNGSGETAASTASSPDFTTSSATSQITVTRPALSSLATGWRAWFSSSSDGHATKRGCGLGGASQPIATGTATFSCRCSTSSTIIFAPSSNTTHETNPLSFASTYTRQPEIAVKEVCLSGCEFTRLGDALTAITDASSTKRYVILIRAPYKSVAMGTAFAGTVTEQVSAKSWVSIIGDNQAVRVGQISIPASVDGVVIANLTLENPINVTGAGAGGKIGIYNVTIGEPGTTIIDGIVDNSGGYDWTVVGLRAYSAYDTVVLNGNSTTWYGLGNQYYISDTATAADLRAFTIGREGIRVHEVSPYIDISTTNSVSQTTPIGALTVRTTATSSTPTIARFLSPTIIINNTYASRTAATTCLSIRDAVAGSSSTQVYVDDMHCQIASNGGEVVTGIDIDSDADHATWKVAVTGGRGIISGGASTYGIRNNETNASFSFTSTGYASGGTFNGAGVIASADTQVGKFTSNLWGPVSDVGSTCTKGQIMPDDGGATDELCVCIADNTVKCVTLGNTNPVD